MTKEELDRGEKLAEQIEVLQRFADKTLRPKKPISLMFWRNKPYRALPITVECMFPGSTINYRIAIHASDRLSQRIMHAIVDELKDLKAEFQEIGGPNDG